MILLFIIAFQNYSRGGMQDYHFHSILSVLYTIRNYAKDHNDYKVELKRQHDLDSSDIGNKK